MIHPDGGNLRLRRFVEHLLQAGIAGMETLRRAVRLRNRMDTRFGQLSVLKGYLEPKDVLRVLAAQIDGDEPFGGIAVSRALLTPERRDEVLSLQSDPVALLGLCLSQVKTTDVENLGRARSEVSEPARTGELPVPMDRPPCRRSPAEIKAVLRAVEHVGAMPAVVSRVLAMLDDPECRLERIARILEEDPAICAQMLRLVHSPLFVVHGKTTSMPKALAILGLKRVRQLLLSSLVADRCTFLETVRARSLWSHSVRTASWARALARARGAKDSDEAFTAGILHDVGRVILYQTSPQEMAEIDGQIDRGVSAAQAESEILGLTHEDAGAFLCEQWSLPPMFSQAAQYHHAPVEILARVRGLLPQANWIHAACRLADASESPSSSPWVEGLEEEFLAHHDLNRGELIEMGLQTHKDVDSAGRLLSEE